MKILKYAAIILINLVFFITSLYLAWGWVVMAEIRSKALAQGYNPEEVIDSLLSSIFEGKTTIGPNSYSFQADRSSGKFRYPEFVRISPEIVYRSIVVGTNGAPQVAEF